MAKGPERIAVRKTYKLYIGGAFPRTESGRYMVARDAKGEIVANVCRASRKDFRDAAVVARKAQAGWAGRTAFNRGQIMYRMAEMLEARSAVFEAALVAAAGLSVKAAAEEVGAAVDRLVWYAGWADKFPQFMGTTNPVASAHFNFTFPEATGVVAAFAPEGSALLGLISAIAPVIVSGNTVIAIVSGPAPTVAMELAEVLVTSDLPGGVVNILTGLRDELAPHVAKHMDVDGILCVGADAATRKLIATEAAESVKRVQFEDDGDVAHWLSDACQSPYLIAPFVELKTAWHPMGV